MISAAAADTAFVLLGDRPSLDLVATLGKRHATPVERIPDPAAFARWLVAAGLLPDPPQVDDGHLTDARRLREAISDVTRAVMAGSALPRDTLATVNAFAARADLPPQLRADGQDRTTAPAPIRSPVTAALATVARDAVRLLGGPHATRIKECAHPDCSLVFVDETQSGRRRWCSMERCGNLVKIAGYRARRSRSDRPSF